MKITILVGTMTGNAMLVAQELELAFGSAEREIEVRAMDGLDAAAFAGGGLYLICTSTYGQGDVPDNARALARAIAGPGVNLAPVRYGLIALGDRTYADTFCFGGRRIDALLAAAGARRIGEPLYHDASGGTLPEDAAQAWMADWLAQLEAA